jgi:hypothetical protein
MQELLWHSTFPLNVGRLHAGGYPSEACSASSSRVASLFLRCEWWMILCRTGKRCYLATQKKGTRRARSAPFLRPRWFQRTPPNSFGKNGGDDETRTRDLCRDRSTFNDIEEHGRHCKSLEVHHRQRYCVSRCVSRSSRNHEKDSCRAGCIFALFQ